LVTALLKDLGLTVTQQPSQVGKKQYSDLTNPSKKYPSWIKIAYVDDSIHRNICITVSEQKHLFVKLNKSFESSIDYMWGISSKNGFNRGRQKAFKT